MKTYSLKSVAGTHENTTLWDAFIAYLEMVYFEGAAETLEPELLNFEYEAYKSCYGK